MDGRELKMKQQVSEGRPYLASGEMSPDLGEQLLQVFERRLYDESPVAALSGWDHVSLLCPPADSELSLKAETLSRYHSENEQVNPTIDRAQDIIARHVKSRFGWSVDWSSMVMAPGATAAIAAAMHCVHSTGIRKALIDAPYYFSYRRLCGYLGLDATIARRTFTNMEGCEPLRELLFAHRDVRKAVVICDPTYVGSRLIPGEEWEILASLLRGDDVLIIDSGVDVTEIPRPLSFARHSIRIITFAKSLALNGVRLAAILGDPETIRAIRPIAATLWGGLDAGMLATGCSAIEDWEMFRGRLRTVTRTATTRRQMAHERFECSRLTFHGGPHGFLGYALLDSSGIGRYRLYQRLMERRVHAIFGRNFGVYAHGTVDVLRLNYLLDIEPALLHLTAALTA